MPTPKKYTLPIIVTAQFACTSLWFAGNAVIGDIIKQFSYNQMLWAIWFLRCN